MQPAPRETRQACVLCYNRKVKCIEDGDSCRACSELQVECRPRVSRRQGRPRGQSKHVFKAVPERAENSAPSDSTDSSVSSDEAQKSLTSMHTEDIGVNPPADMPFPASWTPRTPSRQNSITFLSNPTYGLDADLVNSFPQDLMWPNPPMSQALAPTASGISHEWPAGSIVGDTSLADIPEMDDASSSSVLYDAYVETDTTLQRVRSSAQYICLEDLKEEGLVTRLLSKVAEAATESQDISRALTSQRRGSFTLLAMLAVRKVAELAEHSITVMLPSSMNTGYPVTQHDTDRIAAMLRVDRHLARLNTFVTNFTRSLDLHTLADKSSAFQVQHLLLHIHTRIRSKVESMLTTWDN